MWFFPSLWLFCRMSLKLGFFSGAFSSLCWGYVFLAEYCKSDVASFLMCNIKMHVRSACLVVVTLIHYHAEKCLTTGSPGEIKASFVALANFCGVNTLIIANFKLLSRCQPAENVPVFKSRTELAPALHCLDGKGQQWLWRNSQVPPPHKEAFLLWLVLLIFSILLGSRG